MNQSPPANSRVFTPLASTVLGAWLLVGTLDITGASINFLSRGGRNLGLLFRYIARAVLGSRAATHPLAPLLGGILHYCVALLFTVFFFYGVARARVVRENPIITGIGYGIFMWAVMAFLVLPLTAIGATQVPRTVLQFRQALLAIAILVVAIGWPLAFLARRAARVQGL